MAGSAACCQSCLTRDSRCDASILSRSNQNLLAVEVCLDPANKDTPQAIDCPTNRTAAVGSQPGVADCNGTVYLRLGIEVGALGAGLAC